MEDGDEVPAAEVWDCAVVEVAADDVLDVAATDDWAAEVAEDELQPAATQYAYPILRLR